jgi:hypothetical protein
MSVYYRTFEVKAPLAEVAAFHDDASDLMPKFCNKFLDCDDVM